MDQHYEPLCTVCDRPMIDGQALNGLKRAHWDCAPGSNIDRARRLVRGDASRPATAVRHQPAIQIKRAPRRQPAPSATPPAARFEWIKTWIANKHSADVMDSEFVAAYIDATKAPFIPQMVGADTCRQLGRDLSAMYKAGTLRRARVGLTDHYAGMPNWVYCYSIGG